MVDHVQFRKCIAHLLNRGHTFKAKPMTRYFSGERRKQRVIRTFELFLPWGLGQISAHVCRGTRPACAWAFARGRHAQGRSARNDEDQKVRRCTYRDAEDGRQLLGFLRFERTGVGEEHHGDVELVQHLNGWLSHTDQIRALHDHSIDIEYTGEVALLKEKKDREGAVGVGNQRMLTVFMAEVLSC